MGFGLHAGNAIEAPLGSSMKLDFTYSGKAIEFSEYLEGLTKEYGQAIIMSSDFVELLSENIFSKVRFIDVRQTLREKPDVKVNPNPNSDQEKGEKRGIMVYTFDCNLDRVYSRIDEELNSTYLFSKAGLDSKRKYNPKVWITEPQFLRIRRKYNSKFFKTYEIGLEAYLSGNWKRAKKTLSVLAGKIVEEDPTLQSRTANEIWETEVPMPKEDLMFVYPNIDVDGPSMHLWDIMEKYQSELGEAPEWWQKSYGIKEAKTQRSIMGEFGLGSRRNNPSVGSLG